VWQGKLQDVLRIVVHVGQDSTGRLSSSIDSPDQGAMGLEVDATTFASDTLRLELTRLGASFSGRMSDDGARISGEWHQGGQSLPLALARADSIAPPRRPQEPDRPYPYVEEQVSYPGGAAGVSLAGTLTRPSGAGPFPCVLLITGSGPENRDEMVFGHRPFLVIADHLTRHGIAVLRVDDRGVGGSTGSTENATSEDFAADVLAGLDFLRARPDIDSKHIGLIGHSEGGLIAPMVAGRSEHVAFIVLLAGPGVPGEQILFAQGQAILRAMGKSEQELAQERRVQERLFAIAKQPLDSAAVAARVREAFRAEHIDSVAAAAQIRASIGVARSRWFRFFLTYDPRPALRKLRCPVLALNGGKDMQVPPRQNLPEIERSLKAGGNRDFETRELPGLNHLFQTCTTGAPTEYASIEETFAPAALDAMTEWIRAHAAHGR
jgi:pimeloyl-ACP methyl ester carboxylesterase